MAACLRRFALRRCLTGLVRVVGVVVVGVVVVHSLLEHKRAFVAVDRELFKLLSSHAAPALTAALLFARSDATKPSLTELASITA